MRNVLLGDFVLFEDYSMYLYKFGGYIAFMFGEDYGCRGYW